MPGSKGLMVRTNEEFHVQRILNTPMGLSYEGTPASMIGTGASVMPLLSDVAEVPGESQVGWYDLQTGELEAAAGGELAQMRVASKQEPLAELNGTWLRRVLAVYFDEAALAQLANQLGVSEAGSKIEKIETLVTTCSSAALLDAMLKRYLA
jgi:hypothetical protein